MLKQLIFAFALLVFASSAVQSQTASNFSATDCSGSMHQLYNEMDAGKIIVLCWVMPCSECVGPAMSCHNVVKKFQQSDPDRVKFYLIDDYGNSPCSALSVWAETYSMPVSSFATRFSDSKIVMTDFGAEGMPKIVLVGGSKHSILYSSEFSVNATKLEQAIADQLSTLNDVQDNYSTSLSVQPQPADQLTRIALEDSSILPEQCQLVDAFGRAIAASAYIQLNTGNSLDLDCRTLASGTYTLVLPTSKGVRHASIIVHH